MTSAQQPTTPTTPQAVPTPLFTRLVNLLNGLTAIVAAATALLAGIYVFTSKVQPHHIAISIINHTKYPVHAVMDRNREVKDIAPGDVQVFSYANSFDDPTFKMTWNDGEQHIYIQNLCPQLFSGHYLFDGTKLHWLL